KEIQLQGLESPVDIDITFAHKTNKVTYSTDMALKEFYDSMPEDRRQEVVANVIFAKKFFKAIEAYKPFRGSMIGQGGLGGVGVENWILQNGGSFVAAAREFMQVAERARSFDEFKSEYAVWDFGENHMIVDDSKRSSFSKTKPKHDNFVMRNMSADGYQKMKSAFATFLATIEQ
ncbi:hypothetical protein IJ135_02375, partial [Candidatus Saccharibacteria bacterium]|nr:hypothetical protein [Candidatus Saccharibacteria bacterium]